MQPTDDKAKKKSNDLATKWLGEIDRRRGQEKRWRERAHAVIKRYRDERETGQNSAARWNMLWANTETVKPAIFNRPPVPDVRRRFSTDDPPARTASMIVERCLEYCTDAYDMRDTLDRVNEDYVLPGRGQLVVRYIPTIEKQAKRVPVEPLPEQPEKGSVRDELEAQMDTPAPQYPEGTMFGDDGAPYREEMEEQLVYNEVCPDYVQWDMFVFGACRTWKRCPWVAIGSLLSRDEVLERADYAWCADQLNYCHQERENKDSGEKEKGKFAIFWDVWHKASRTFLVVVEKFEYVVVEQPDPLRLEGFFPCPEPIYSIRNNGTWEPTPEFCLYQDQALELDEIADRLKNLEKMVKIRGAYDKAVDNEQFKFSDIMRAADGTIMPVDGWRQLMEKGGLEGVIDFLPIDQIIQAIKELTVREQVLKEMIYELTGISDIVRGSSDPNETLGAQNLKAQYAGLRISTRQQRFQRMIRETYCIMAEIIGEHFDPQTLKLMSGINVLPDQAYEQAKMAKNLPAGAVSESEFMAAIQILKSDKLRGFKVDVETDSTIPADKEAEKGSRIEFLTAVSGYMQAAAPLVAQGVLPKNVAVEGLMFAVRGFKIGSEFEEVLEQLREDDGGVNPQAMQQMQGQLQELQKENDALKADQQVKMVKAQSDVDVAQYKAQSDVELNKWKAQQEMALKQATADHDMKLASIDQMMQAMLKKMGIQMQADAKKQNGKQPVN